MCVEQFENYSQTNLFVKIADDRLSYKLILDFFLNFNTIVATEITATITTTTASVRLPPVMKAAINTTLLTGNKVKRKQPIKRDSDGA